MDDEWDSRELTVKQESASWHGLTESADMGYGLWHLGSILAALSASGQRPMELAHIVVEGHCMGTTHRLPQQPWMCSHTGIKH